MLYLLHDPFDLESVAELIREVAKFGTVSLTKHCRQKMAVRNITFPDLMSVLQTGEIEEPPERGCGPSQFKYKVKGSTIDEDTAVAITLIIDHKSLLIVTVF